jgi:aspartate carbamoyltransferase catalytic subunit
MSHLFDIDALTADGIEQILDEAERMSDSSDMPLRGKHIINFFAEASTRTRVSFEMPPVAWAHKSSTLQRAAAVLRRASRWLIRSARSRRLARMLSSIRHAEPGAPYLAARHFHGPVINAGDGRHAHPTQALLDLLTMRQRFGALRGLRIAIVGDVAHSRVARSTTLALLFCGADVRLCAPPTLFAGSRMADCATLLEYGRYGIPDHLVREALDGAQVVMPLRCRRSGSGAVCCPVSRSTHACTGSLREKLADLAPDVLVMHPGPANEGVEISPELMSGPASLIGQQVENGVLVRMAVLNLLLGASGE